MAMEPKGIIIHAMGEFIGRDGLKWLKRYNKEENTYEGKPLDEYPEQLHAPEWLRLSRLSVHGYIAPDGEWIAGKEVPEKAAHAGKSVFGELSGLNSHFLGFEMLVPGLNDYGSFIDKINNQNPYSEAQLDTAAKKCIEWMQTYNIPLANIVGHSDVSGDAVRGEGKGKKDPGKSFDLEAFKRRVNAKFMDPFG